MHERGKQNFQGSVDKVAGRDVNIYGACPHPTNQEWEIQKSFEEATGICCNKQAREWLTSLMVEHGFTVKELGDAWRMGVIRWSTERDEPKINSNGFDLFYGYGFLLTCLIYFTAISAVFTIGPGAGHKFAFTIVAGSVLLFLLITAGVRKLIVNPRTVALRVRAIMQTTSRLTEQQACR